MGRIPEDIVEDVLLRTDILQVIQQYVSLKRSGTNHKGLCPFHGEKTPSFYVHGGKGIYKCFGCGAGGNAYQFLMEMEGWSFPEAVRHLAGRLGVEIPAASEEESEEARKRAEAKKLYVGIMEGARRFYERALWGEEVEGSEAARKYLQDRGIGEDVAREFGLGYAPAGWQNLLDHLREKGYGGALVERAGMALVRQGSSGHYDRFRDRIMFPVIDIWGNTLAFGGRVLPGDDGPKYINSSETRFYTKGNHLFGLHAAKRGIQREGWALLVEGNFDVIALHAAGLDMTVAPMGTSFTDRQAKLLKRYAGKVYIAFDGDSAGEEATVRCLQAMEQADIEAWVIRFERGEDPDSFIRAQGAEALRQKIEGAQPLVGWALDRILPQSDSEENLPIEERVKLLEQAAEVMKHVRNPVVWRHYAEDIASRRLDIEPRLFKRYLKKPEAMEQEVKRALSAEEESHGATMQLDKTEFGLLALLLKHPEWLGEFLAESLENLLKSAELAGFLHQISAHLAQHGGELNAALLLREVAHPGMRRVVSEAMASAGSERVHDSVASDKAEELEEKAVQSYQDTLRVLKYEWAERSLRAVDEQLATVDFSKDREAYMQAYQHKRQLEQFKSQHAAARRAATG